MGWLSWVIAIVLGVGLGLIINTRKPINRSIIHLVNEEDFKNNMRKGQLIDIRKSDDFEQDRIKGARNFTPRHITSKYSKVRKDQSVFLYCNNGKKSLRLAKKMSKENYKAIYVLEAGLEGMKK